jgi:hypothetical protein
MKLSWHQLRVNLVLALIYYTIVYIMFNGNVRMAFQWTVGGFAFWNVVDIVANWRKERRESRS